MGHHRGVKPGRPPELCATLKLLVASVVRRRNVPPSSRVSKQWPRSFGIRSDAPSRASSLSLARPHRNRGTDPPHSWRGSQCPAHYKSRVVVCCGSGAAFASVRSSGRPESDRCRESGAVVSRLYVSGSPPITRDAGFVVTSAVHPTADRAARLAGVPLRARSCVTIPPDSVEHRLGYPHKGCSNRDTEP